MPYIANPETPEPQTGTPGSPAGAASSSDDGNLCIICLERPIEVALIPCGHAKTCTVCCVEMQQHERVPRCPVCRAEVESTLRVYI